MFLFERFAALCSDSLVLAALFSDSLVPLRAVFAALFSDSLVPFERFAALFSDSLVLFERFAARFLRFSRPNLHAALLSYSLVPIERFADYSQILQSLSSGSLLFSQIL